MEQEAREELVARAMAAMSAAAGGSADGAPPPPGTEASAAAGGGLAADASAAALAALASEASRLGGGASSSRLSALASVASASGLDAAAEGGGGAGVPKLALSGVLPPLQLDDEAVKALVRAKLAARKAQRAAALGLAGSGEDEEESEEEESEEVETSESWMTSEEDDDSDEWEWVTDDDAEEDGEVEEGPDGKRRRRRRKATATAEEKAARRAARKAARVAERAARGLPPKGSGAYGGGGRKGKGRGRGRRRTTGSDYDTMSEGEVRAGGQELQRKVRRQKAKATRQLQGYYSRHLRAKAAATAAVEAAILVERAQDQAIQQARRRRDRLYGLGSLPVSPRAAGYDGPAWRGGGAAVRQQPLAMTLSPPDTHRSLTKGPGAHPYRRPPTPEGYLVRQRGGRRVSGVSADGEGDGEVERRRARARARAAGRGHDGTYNIVGPGGPSLLYRPRPRTGQVRRRVRPSIHQANLLKVRQGDARACMQAVKLLAVPTCCPGHMDGRSFC